jgi:hypothetical protein
MAHFAELDENNTVIRVLVVPNEQEHRGQEYLANELGLGGLWVQTSYNSNIRKNYAGVGHTFDTVRDAFIAPKPECHPDLVVLDEETCTWSCPDATHVVILGE